MSFLPAEFLEETSIHEQSFANYLGACLSEGAISNEKWEAISETSKHKKLARRAQQTKT